MPPCVLLIRGYHSARPINRRLRRRGHGRCYSHLQPFVAHRLVVRRYFAVYIACACRVRWPGLVLVSVRYMCERELSRSTRRRASISNSLCGSLPPRPPAPRPQVPPPAPRLPLAAARPDDGAAQLVHDPLRGDALRVRPLLGLEPALAQRPVDRGRLVHKALRAGVVEGERACRQLRPSRDAARSPAEPGQRKGRVAPAGTGGSANSSVSSVDASRPSAMERVSLLGVCAGRCSRSVPFLPV